MSSNPKLGERREMTAIEHLDSIVNSLRRLEKMLINVERQSGGVVSSSELDAIKTQVSSCYDVMQSMSETTANSLSSILSTQQEQGKVLADLQLTLGTRQSLQIQFEGSDPMAPGSMSDTQTIQATEIETDAAGQPVSIQAGNVVWAIDDPTIASFTMNPDGSATFKGLKPGNATISCTDNSQTPPVVGTNTLQVTSSGPNTLTISFGNPQDPTPPAPTPQPSPDQGGGGTPAVS
jgi:hypothetical protein